MPKYRTLPKVDALCVNLLYGKLREVGQRRELRRRELIDEIRRADEEIDQIARAIAEVLAGHGFDETRPVGAVVVEAGRGLPAGTVVAPDGTPYLEEEDGAAVG